MSYDDWKTTEPSRRDDYHPQPESEQAEADSKPSAPQAPSQAAPTLEELRNAQLEFVKKYPQPIPCVPPTDGEIGVGASGVAPQAEAPTPTARISCPVCGVWTGSPEEYWTHKHVEAEAPTPTQPKQTLCSHGVLPEWCDSCAHAFHGCLISDMMAWIDALGEKTETIYGGSKLHARHDPRCDVYLQQPCNCGLVGEAEAPRGDQNADRNDWPEPLRSIPLCDLTDDALIDWLGYCANKELFWGSIRQEILRRIRLEAKSAPSVDRAVYLLEIVSKYFAANPIAAEYTINYDEAVCDGGCLAEDCRIAAEQLRHMQAQTKEK